MRYTHIVWDFNGTILNDVGEAIKSINTLLQRRQMKAINSIEAYHEVFSFPITDYYKTIGFDFDKEPFNDIANEWVEQYMLNSKTAKIYDGVIDIFSKIRERKVKQILLSATQRDMLITQLTQYNILNYFDEVIGLNNIYAHSKVEVGKDWCMREKPKNAVMIGDTTHDFEVSRAMEIDCILVANGHQSKSVLLGCGCTVVDNISQVTELI